MAKITVWWTQGTIKSFLDAAWSNMAEFVWSTDVLIKNNDTGKIVYLSRNIEATTAAGYPLGAAGSVSIPFKSLAEFHIISDTSSTDVRILPAQ